MAPVKLFLPLLTYNHTCLTEFSLSVMRLVLYCRDNNIGMTIYPITFDSLVSRARNAAVAAFLSEPDATHLLFIDADIEFTPQDVMKLLFANKDVVCASYAKKFYDVKKMAEVFRMDPIPSDPLAHCTHGSVHYISGAGAGSEVEYATTGFLLIRRGVFEKLIAEYPERKYRNDIDGYSSSNPDAFYDFFCIHVDPNTRRLLSEDYGFSALWRSIGGRIHCVSDITLRHYGWQGYAHHNRFLLEPTDGASA